MAAESNEKKRRERGSGHIFKPKWKDRRTGEYRECRNFWIQYYRHGRKFAENTRSDLKSVANALLKKRLGEIVTGQFTALHPERVTYKELRSALLADYETNGRKSLQRRKVKAAKDGAPEFESFVCGLDALDGFFENMRVIEITTDRINEFKVKRQKDGAPNSTINRSLALLRRMLRLAQQADRLRVIPYVPMLKEPPARKGFLEVEAFRKLRQELPDYLRPLATMGFFTGMRLGEILSLQWENVNFLDAQIRLDPGTTKNDEPRVIPLTGELLDLLKLERQKRDTEYPNSPFVFSHDGRPFRSFRKAWAKACVRADIGRIEEAENGKVKYRGLIFHDLRRAGVRNLVRAGVPERVAMAISGHKTRAVFERYNIVSGKDLKDAAARLERYVAKQNDQTSTKARENHSHVAHTSSQRTN